MAVDISSDPVGQFVPTFGKAAASATADVCCVQAALFHLPYMFWAD